MDNSKAYANSFWGLKEGYSNLDDTSKILQENMNQMCNRSVSGANLPNQHSKLLIKSPNSQAWIAPKKWDKDRFKKILDKQQSSIKAKLSRQSSGVRSVFNYEEPSVKSPQSTFQLLNKSITPVGRNSSLNRTLTGK